MGNNQGLLKTEDWWSVWLGLFIFILSLGSLVPSFDSNRHKMALKST